MFFRGGDSLVVDDASVKELSTERFQNLPKYLRNWKSPYPYDYKIPNSWLGDDGHPSSFKKNPYIETWADVRVNGVTPMRELLRPKNLVYAGIIVFVVPGFWYYLSALQRLNNPIGVGPERHGEKRLFWFFRGESSLPPIEKFKKQEQEESKYTREPPPLK